MSITEDDLANAIINRHCQLSELWENSYNAYPEAHYNYYGNRGAADLYITEENKDGPNGNGFLYELKSEYAMKQATGANEVIRQFNKMREFFFKGNDHHLPHNMIRFTLAFVGTPHNLQHIYDNIDLYESMATQSFYQEDNVEEETVIQLNDPYELAPVTVVAGGNGDRVTPITQGSQFVPYVEGQNQAIFDRCESVVRRIADEAPSDA